MKKLVNGVEVNMTSQEVAAFELAQTSSGERTVDVIKGELANLDARVSREKETLVESRLLTLPKELMDVIAQKEALREEMNGIE